MTRVFAIVAAAGLALAPGVAVAGQAPQWKLELLLGQKVASSHYGGTVVRRYAGPRTRIGERVTLRIGRNSHCRRQTGALSVPIRCGSLGSLVAGDPRLDVLASGQFETGHLGAIGFLAQTLLVRQAGPSRSAR